MTLRTFITFWGHLLHLRSQAGRAGGGGGWLLVAGLWVGRSVGVLLPWGVIAVATPWSLGTQPPLAMWALTSIADPNLVLYKILKNSTSPC